MRAVFCGTPDFAVKALEKLIDENLEIVLAVTQPDRQRGRGKEIAFSPVKECALAHNIPVFQPEKIRTPEALEELGRYPADICIVAAFGQIIPKAMLEMYPMGCINIHGSLLPKYRGAAPIQWALLDGLEETGITIMQMDEGLDTGDILLQKVLPIDASDTGGSLFEKMALLGGEAVSEALPLLEAGKLKPIVQNNEESTYAGRLTKTMGELDFERPAVELERYVRGLNPWPGAYTYFNNRLLKIWDSEVREDMGTDAVPGTVVSAGNELVIRCGSGALALKRVQLEGKKAMLTEDFLRGVNIKEGITFGRKD